MTLCALAMDVKFLTADPRGKKQSNPVKFSTMTKLSSEECERLLAKFVPVSIRKTKISQQLFLKSVCYQVYVHVCVCACVRALWTYICSAYMVKSWRCLLVIGSVAQSNYSH